jgi:hypothetical protein
MENLSTALSVVAVLAEPLGENATLIGPVHYRSFAASRFARASFAYFHLEDFENGILDTFNVLAPHGMVLQPAGQAVPAEAEDGTTDNARSSHTTWYADGNSILTFSFSKELLGEWPTDAGLIWTDVGFANIRGGFKSVLFEAFDASNNLLGAIGPSAMGDGLFAGQTAEDRFFGVTSANGVGSIRITPLSSTEQGIDQFGYHFAESMQLDANSESAALALLVVGHGGSGFKRRHLQS